MSVNLPISWLESNGWLVLSGSADPLSEIRARALSRCNAGGAIACVSLADDLGDSLLDDMAELGAPAGYLVDLADQDNNEIHEGLSQAGMIVIEASIDFNRLKRLMTHTVVHALKEALEQGALILFEGVAAALAGTYHVAANAEIVSGLRFVQDALILPDVRSAAQSEAAQQMVRAQPDAVCIAIERGAALVLGPMGHIETWGENAVTFSLGSPSREANPTIDFYD